MKVTIVASANVKEHHSKATFKTFCSIVCIVCIDFWQEHEPSDSTINRQVDLSAGSVGMCVQKPADMARLGQTRADESDGPLPTCVLVIMHHWAVLVLIIVFPFLVSHHPHGVEFSVSSWEHVFMCSTATNYRKHGVLSHVNKPACLVSYLKIFSRGVLCSRWIGDSVECETWCQSPVKSHNGEISGFSRPLSC